MNYSVAVALSVAFSDAVSLAPDEDDEPFNINADRVAYSLDGKTLKFCRFNFNKLRYRVPDGVEEIEEGAFLSCRHFVELSIPRSVRVIGDYLFGNGGLITIRD